MDQVVHFNVQPTVRTAIVLAGVQRVGRDLPFQLVIQVSEAAYCKRITIFTKHSCLSSTGLFKSNT